MKGPAPNNQPLGLEAFVLHHRNGSMVTVGQFDSATDPALAETRRLLSRMNFLSRDPHATGSTDQFLAETMIPIPIPKP